MRRQNLSAKHAMGTTAINAMYGSLVMLFLILGHLTRNAVDGRVSKHVQAKVFVATSNKRTESNLGLPLQDEKPTEKVVLVTASQGTQLRSSLQNERLTKALVFVRQSQKNLLEYYHGDEHILNKAPYASPEGDSALASKMAKTIYQSVILGKNTSFNIGVLGSSVTAGHDTFRLASWPFVLGRHLEKLWSVLGVSVTVRNQAEGATAPDMFYSLCLPLKVGDDIDLLIRESMYWPWETGVRDVIDIAKEGAPLNIAAFEVLLRCAWSLPRQPAVHILQVKTTTGHPDPLGYMKEFLFEMKPYTKNGFAVNAFDAFAKPFDHFTQRFKPRLARHTGNQAADPCSSTSVSDCPINITMQDGHHRMSVFIQELLQKHPEWRESVELSGDFQLWIKWHPGSLGHEVIANQMAYYHMKVMEKTLLLILQGQGNLYAVQQHLELPTPVACKFEVCGVCRAQCASAQSERVAGLDMADIMINDTGHSWIEKDLGSGRGAPKPPAHIRQDFWWEKLTSGPTGIRKRGVHGKAANGTLSLRFDNLQNCMIFLFQPVYSFGKPPNVANWELELITRVNGRVCSEPGCRRTHGSTLVIDARSFVPGKCKDGSVRVDLEVKPVDHPNFGCYAFASRCKLDPKWSGYSWNHFCSRSRTDSQTCTNRQNPRKGSLVEAVIARAVGI